ncbi:pimeloyl-CoA dehydrogenase [Rhizobium sp. Leaf371]|uniref:pirin family protein n=1 Tax=Rhizobium sp. Leaf371 TaxID=1736355 RepID=UPI00071552E2|nr:pirin family protein [Rhizobium sp. Leaf371]KQS71383.1 pimeloyl-CoA dehydrogenase [Rhizobium sp. Leaf371]
MTITKIPAGRMRGNFVQGFGVEILYPGLSLTADDSGIGPIGRIDRAQVQPGHLIGMHPHKDDEILTYIRGGEMLHRDTVGNGKTLDKTHFMMMNAGHTFQHEELMLGNSPVRALQIFLRPNARDLEPMVQFHDFIDASSENEWRLIAGPKQAPLTVRSDIQVFDARVSKGTQLSLPAAADPRTAFLLYVFDGAIDFGDVTITTGESAFTRSLDHQLTARAGSDVVLFAFDPKAEVFHGGMFSGNQKRVG